MWAAEQADVWMPPHGRGFVPGGPAGRKGKLPSGGPGAEAEHGLCRLP